MPHSYSHLLYHIVFATKERHPWIGPAVRPGLFHFLQGGIMDQRGSVLAINGVADHVHLLVKLRPDRAVSEVLRVIKSHSSGWLHAQHPELAAFAWQSGYGAFSVSKSKVEVVRAYIDRQEEHHRTRSFAEEFVQLLVDHGVEFDHRYLWD